MLGGTLTAKTAAKNNAIASAIVPIVRRCADMVAPHHPAIMFMRKFDYKRMQIGQSRVGFGAFLLTLSTRKDRIIRKNSRRGTNLGSLLRLGAVNPMRPRIAIKQRGSDLKCFHLVKFLTGPKIALSH
jgi:hypothetical protein